MNRILTAALFVLALSAPALADSVPQGAKLFASQPVGNGEPNAISCYRAELTGSHTTKTVCHRNLEWARLNAGGDLSYFGAAAWQNAGAASGSFGPSPRASDFRGN